MPFVPVGDKGQRYALSSDGYPFEDKACVMGWCDDRAHASNMAAALRKAPGCRSTTIRDRWGREPDSVLAVNQGET